MDLSSFYWIKVGIKKMKIILSSDKALYSVACFFATLCLNGLVVSSGKFFLYILNYGLKSYQLLEFE